MLSGATGRELHSYNQALPLMMVRYLGPGLLGPGHHRADCRVHERHGGQRERLLHGVDLRHLQGPDQQDARSISHYVLVGRLSIVIGVAVSIGAAYLVMHAHGIMDYVQALFSIFVAPLLAIDSVRHVLDARHALAGFLGLLCGIVFSASLFMWVKFTPSALANVALSPDAKPMAENVFRALWAFIFTAIIVVGVSMVTKPRPDSELDGLVYGATILPTEEPVPFYKKRVYLGDRGRGHLCGSQHSILVASGGGKGRIDTYAWFRDSQSGSSSACCWWLYGGMIASYGIYEWATASYPAGVQLTDLHAPVWWGGNFAALGLLYVIKFRPGRASM